MILPQLNGTTKLAGSITAICLVVAMSFGAWFTVLDAIAGEAEKITERIQNMELQQKAEDVDFAIYQVAHKMDVIEERADNNQAFSGDQTRLHQLERELDILLRRQETVLKRLEANVK